MRINGNNMREIDEVNTIANWCVCVCVRGVWAIYTKRGIGNPKNPPPPPAHKNILPNDPSTENKNNRVNVLRLSRGVLRFLKDTRRRRRLGNCPIAIGHLFYWQCCSLLSIGQTIYLVV